MNKTHRRVSFAFLFLLKVYSCYAMEQFLPNTQVTGHDSELEFFCPSSGPMTPRTPKEKHHSPKTCSPMVLAHAIRSQHAPSPMNLSPITELIGAHLQSNHQLEPIGIVQTLENKYSKLNPTLFKAYSKQQKRTLLVEFRTYAYQLLEKLSNLDKRITNEQEQQQLFPSPLTDGTSCLKKEYQQVSSEIMQLEKLYKHITGNELQVKPGHQ